MKRRWGLALAVLVAGLPTGAAHAAGWRAQEVLVPEGSVGAYDAAIAPEGGESVHVWSRDGDQVEAHIRPLTGGGTRQTLEVVSLAEPRVAVVAGGRATAVWASGANVKAARRAPGAAFGAPEILGPGTAPDVVGLTDGTTWIAWVDGNHIEVRRSAGGPAAFAPEPDITPPDGFTPRGVRLWPGRNGELLLTYVGRSTGPVGGPVFSTTDRLRAALKATTEDALSGDQGVLHESSWPHIGSSPPGGAGVMAGGVAFAGGIVSVVAEDSDSFNDSTGTGESHVVAISRPLASPGSWSTQELDAADYQGGSGDLATGSAAAPVGDAGALLLWAYDEADDDGAGTQIRVARRDGSSIFVVKPPLADRGPDERQVHGPSIAPLTDGLAIAAFGDAGAPTPMLVGSALLGPAEERREVLTTGFGNDSDVPAANDFRFPLITSADGHALTATSPGSDMIALHRLDATPPELAVTVPERVDEDTTTGLAATATDDLGSPTVRWELGDGRTVEGANPGVSWAQPGRYTVTAIADDGVGNETRASRTVTVAAVVPPPGTLPRPLPLPPVLDRRSPVVSALTLSRSRFAVGPQPTALTAQRRRRTPRGTTLSFRLSEPARVAVVVERVRRGFVVGRRGPCRSRRPRTRSRVRRCTVYSVRGTIRRNGVAGVNRLAFSGRLGRRALPRGSYRLRVLATDAAGNVSRPALRAFRIVR